MFRSMRLAWLSAFVLLVGACGGGGGSSLRVSVDPKSVSVSASRADTASPTAAVTIRLSRVPPDGTAIYVGYQISGEGLESASFQGTSDTEALVTLRFAQPSQSSPGTYDGAVTILVCYDQACASPLDGSPLTIQTHYTITGDLPQSDLDPITPSSISALAHDVVDAEYSAVLDEVVMVASYPASALYLHDPHTGTVRQLALVKTPTAVSVGPDGHHAVVGHDGLLSYVDLDMVGQPGYVPVTWPVSADVLDIVLAGNGYAYAFPRYDQWESIRSIRLSTGVETLGGESIYAGTLARLHPSGSKMYGADNGLSPSDIERYEFSGGTAQLVYDSPYHGDYAMCGNLWFSRNGANIFTACGNIFRASDVRNLDMRYAGSLSLSTDQLYGYRITSLSQSDSKSEVALLEAPPYCSQGSSCEDRFRLYESSYFSSIGTYWVPNMKVSGNDYRQHGLFVFHDAAGTARILITRLEGMPNPDAEYYLSVMY